MLAEEFEQEEGIWDHVKAAGKMAGGSLILLILVLVVFADALRYSVHQVFAMLLKPAAVENTVNRSALDL